MMATDQWGYGDTSAISAESLFEKLLLGMRLVFDTPAYPLTEEAPVPVEEVSVEVYLDGDVFLNSHVLYTYGWNKVFTFAVDPSPLIAELTQELLKLEFDDDESSRKWVWVVKQREVKKRVLAAAFPVPPTPTAEDVADALYLNDDPFAAGMLLFAPCLAWQIGGKVFAAIDPSAQDVQQAIRAASLACNASAEEDVKSALKTLR